MHIARPTFITIGSFRIPGPLDGFVPSMVYAALACLLLVVVYRLYLNKKTKSGLSQCLAPPNFEGETFSYHDALYDKEAYVALLVAQFSAIKDLGSRVVYKTRAKERAARGGPEAVLASLELEALEQLGVP